MKLLIGVADHEELPLLATGEVTRRSPSSHGFALSFAHRPPRGERPYFVGGGGTATLAMVVESDERHGHDPCCPWFQRVSELIENLAAGTFVRPRVLPYIDNTQPQAWVLVIVGPN